MKYDFITVGGATEDNTFHTNEGIVIDNEKDVLKQRLLAFEYGTKIKIEKATSTYGGGAANAAVCLAKIGYKVSALVAIGDDFRGEGIIKNFKKFNVGTDLVQKKKTGTGFSFLLVGQENEHIVFSNRAANSELSIGPKEKQALKKTKWVYLTSLSGDWIKTLDNLFSHKKFMLAWNPGHIQLNSGIKKISKYIKKTNVLIMNKDEAIELVYSDMKNRKKGSDFLNNIKNLLQVLNTYGPDIVVVTDGRHGAHAYDGEKYYFQKILKEKTRVDTTGVGDAFGSTFIAGLNIFKGDIKKAMYMGVKNTASVVGEQGAQNGLLFKKDF